MDGVLLLDKPAGMTSHDCVNIVRKVLKTKKVGHTGTLDPDAEGVLPVCLGRATKVCDLLTDKDKEYETVLLLGVVTDTQDLTGEVLARKEVNASENEVKSAILSFVGEYMQVPPMYSALKVNGQKLCDLARKGVTVERKARPVTIHGIEILSVDLPEVRMRVHCSKGTYIRTLCQDIGEKLGCGGCMKLLLRTRVAAFALKYALKLDELESKLKSGDESFIHSVDSVFGQYEKASVLEKADKLVRNGNRIPEEFIDHMQDAYKQECIRLYGWEQTFIGLYAYMPETKDFKPIKLFQTEL